MDWAQVMKLVPSYLRSRTQLAYYNPIPESNILAACLDVLDPGGRYYDKTDLIGGSDDDDDDDDDYDYYEDEEEEELRPHPRIKQLTPEEAEKHAQELREEEERKRKKLEKKRQKRLRHKGNQKEKKLERINAVKDNKLPDEEEQEQSTTSSEHQAENIDNHHIKETEELLVGETHSIQTKAEATVPEEKNGSDVREKGVTLVRESKKKKKKKKDHDGLQPEDEPTVQEPQQQDFDLNSCFVSTAADIVKKKLEKKPKSERENVKKKKKRNHHDPVQTGVHKQQQDDEEQGQSTTSSENQEESIDIHHIRGAKELLIGKPHSIQTKTEVTAPEEKNSSDVREKAVLRDAEDIAANVSKKHLEEVPKPKGNVEKKKTKKIHHHNDVNAEDKPEIPEPQQEKMSDVAVEAVQISTELANMGNQYAAHGRLDVAVMYFTDAIKHNPREYKLFGNRSFCYEKMQQYENALLDADLALSMEPGWIKGLFRKGKALCGLKRYYEASLTYKEVLEQDSSSADASQELTRVYVMQLMEMGFTSEQSLEALKAHVSFEEAVEALSSGIEGASAGSGTSGPTEEDWVEIPERTSHTQQQTQTTNTTRLRGRQNGLASYLAQESYSVWVGSLVPSITRPILHSLFSRAGVIHRINILMEHQCAFVHYLKREDCETAIELLDEYEVEGVCLQVRYPNRNNPGVAVTAVADYPVPEISAKVKQKVKLENRKECYFWRTTGCSKMDCPFLHIPEHHGSENWK